MTTAWVQAKTADTPFQVLNHTTIYIPIGPMGVPLVGALHPGERIEPSP